MQGELPFDDACLPRRARLKLWLRRRGYASLAALARDMGVHPTYPGKLLLSRTEELTPERREWLRARDCPEELLGVRGRTWCTNWRAGPWRSSWVPVATPDENRACAAISPCASPICGASTRPRASIA